MDQSFVDVIDYCGKKAYLYECVDCGRRTRYLRRIHTPPMCWTCQQKRIKQRDLERKARKMSEYEKEVVTHTLDELLSRLDENKLLNQRIEGIIEEMKGEL